MYYLKFAQLLNNIEAELKSWKIKQKQLLKADEALTLLQQLELECVWVNVLELEKELRKLQTDVEDAVKAKNAVCSNIEKWQEKQEQLRERIRFRLPFDSHVRP